nr:hypothetical protein [uncultured Lichenicoccus sp.]
MAQDQAGGTRAKAVPGRRGIVAALALLPLAACSAPAAPQHTDPFYLAPATPGDRTTAPTVTAGPRSGGGAHGGGAGGQYPGQGPGLGRPDSDMPGSGSMSVGGGGGGL